MAITQLSVSTCIRYILVGGVVLFLAVFLGIRAGLAVKGTPDLSLTPEKLRNTTTMKIGDDVPALPLRAENGRLTDLGVIGHQKRTVVAIVLPGCFPCLNMLENWANKELAHKIGEIQLVLLAGVSPDNSDLKELAGFASDYPVYFGNIEDLRSFCGITTFPTLLGIGADSTIRFVANAAVYGLDEVFFNKYM